MTINPHGRMSRRGFLGALAGLGTLALAPGAEAAPMRTRAIPKSGEAVPVIGMGSWQTLNVGGDAGLRAARLEVVRTFFDQGGGMIDSSPMYGSSEEVIGHCLARIADTSGLYSATKVWTPTRWLGIKQMKKSFDLWGLRKFDLFQIHNLLDWETHMETLLDWKAAGRVRYIGVTTSHGRRHDELAAIMASQPIDFVQLTYNVLDRQAERRLLPLARERGLAVIVNRPFRRGALFDRIGGRPLPGWAAEIDCSNWAQIFLQFIIAHPAVTCAIPATSRVDHMLENMGGGRGNLPDANFRRRIIRDVENL